jgi:hypothetical protein
MLIREAIERAVDYDDWLYPRRREGARPDRCRVSTNARRRRRPLGAEARRSSVPSLMEPGGPKKQSRISNESRTTSSSTHRPCGALGARRVRSARDCGDAPELWSLGKKEGRREFVMSPFPCIVYTVCTDAVYVVRVLHKRSSGRDGLRAMAGKARRQRWHVRQSRQRGFCKL